MKEEFDQDLYDQLEKDIVEYQRRKRLGIHAGQLSIPFPDKESGFTKYDSEGRYIDGDL